MTHHPHLPTLEQVMNGSPFDIVDSPWGHIERWRASTLSTGTMGALAQVYDVVRSDGANLAARADEDAARTALVQHLCDKIIEFEERFDALEARVNDTEDKRRADQEQQREFEEEPLEQPPGQEPDDPAAQDNINTHEPSGDLHTLAVKSEEPPEPLAEDEELPSELPQQAEFALPEPGMTTDARRKARGSVVSQPISVSLNEG